MRVLFSSLKFGILLTQNHKTSREEDTFSPLEKMVIKMKNQNFGVEIELTGITRKRAAEVIANYFGTASHYERGGYDAYTAADRKGRTWKVMRDSSINTEGRGGEYASEVVTPILQYGDISDLQEILRQLRHAGAKANSSCGIHIHVGAEKHTAKTLRNLVNIMASKQDMIYKALQINPNRASTYCKKLEANIIEKFNSQKPDTKDKIKVIPIFRNRKYQKCRCLFVCISYQN